MSDEKSAGEKAQEAQKAREEATDTVKQLEDDPPKKLEDWPSDQAKYITFGGAEGDHSYEEGPEAKLGPSSLQRYPDGSVSIGGEKVDNPDDYKGEPIPGGPTDPKAPDMPGDRKLGAAEQGGDEAGQGDGEPEGREREPKERGQDAGD